MPTYLDDLPTPALLIERERLLGNIDRMQSLAEREGVNLRPHTKTHKSVEIARIQRSRGARGITVAKTSEAEVFAEAGFDDIRIASTVFGTDKWERIARLAKNINISFCIDSAAAVEGASKVFEASGLVVDVLMEVDPGYHRCGVDPDTDEAIEIARMITKAKGLRLTGLLTHAGQGYYGPSNGESRAEALRIASEEERDSMLRLAARLHKAGIEGVHPDGFELSIGSTPTMSAFTNATMHGFRITEIRPGNYVFNDMIQVTLGVARMADCALTVLSKAISRHRDRSGKERLFLDAGKKVLTSDTGALTDGYGTILFNAATMTPLPHARITALSEEHGWVQIPGGATIDIGNDVRIVPNHACVVVNTQDNMYLVNGDEVVGTIAVDARGKVE